MPKMTKVGYWLPSLGGSDIILSQITAVEAIRFLNCTGQMRVCSMRSFRSNSFIFRWLVVLEKSQFSIENHFWVYFTRLWDALDKEAKIVKQLIIKTLPHQSQYFYFRIIFKYRITTLPNCMTLSSAKNI